MTINHMWSWDEHAYQCALSTATALLTLQEEWLERMENKLQSLLVSLDMSSAFDTICHEVLLSKLQVYGVGEGAIQLLRSYLLNTSQVVEIGDHKSRFNWMKDGSRMAPVLAPSFLS